MNIMEIDNALERGNNSTVNNIHFERLFTQQLNCLQNSLNRVHTLIIQVQRAATSLRLRELLHEYLEQIDKEKERSVQLLTAMNITPGYVRDDVIEGFALEVKKISHATFENRVRDAGYCFQVRKLMQYLISFYEGLKEMAHMLQVPVAVKILEEGFYGECDSRLMLTCLVTEQITWLEYPHKNEHII
jgi:ferritin-like metal-binding protein YciE